VAKTHEIGFSSSGSERLARVGRGSGRVDAALSGIFVFAAGAVAGALVSQHRFGMDPCPWCILQRLIYCTIALAALLGLAWRRPAGRRIGGGLALLLAIAGMAAALWQHFVAAASESCNLTLADKIMNATRLPTLLPEAFEPRASCADAAVSLFGVSYDLWSLAGFVLVAVLAIVALAAVRGRRSPTHSSSSPRREPT
jgi:disulfide bond formation protein DsbB